MSALTALPSLAAMMEPANLAGFDFIRLSNPTHSVHGILGEISPEIDAVADAAPDLAGDADRDQDIDLTDIAAIQTCMGSAVGLIEHCDNVASRGAVWIDSYAAMVAIERMTGPNSP